jgi:hypothetical protein
VGIDGDGIDDSGISSRENPIEVEREGCWVSDDVLCW